MGRLWLVLALVLAPIGAGAGTMARAAPSLTTTAQGGSVSWMSSEVSALLSKRAVVPSGGAVAVQDSFNLLAPTGESVAVTASRVAQIADIAAVAGPLMASLLGRAALPIAAASAIYDIAKSLGYGVSGDPGVGGAAAPGAVVGDAGQPQSIGEVYDCGSSYPDYSCVRTASLQAANAYLNSSKCPGGIWHCSVGTTVCSTQGPITGHYSTICTTTIIRYYDVSWFPYKVDANDAVGANYSTSTTAWCPQTSLAPLKLVGSQPCASDARTEVPAPVLTDMLKAATASQAAQIAQGVLTAPVPQTMTPSAWDIPASDGTLTGPSTYGQPQTSTTTAPDGTVTTKTDTPGITYDGNSYRWNNSSTTNVTNNNNNTSTTTTTVTQGKSPDTPDPCLANPDRIGCSSWGSPDQQQVPKTTQSLTFSPVSLPGAGCPGDVTFVAFGTTYVMPFGGVCDATVTIVKPVVLILGAAVAAFIFIGGLKS